jgi:hypothetical protein
LSRLGRALYNEAKPAFIGALAMTQNPNPNPNRPQLQLSIAPDTPINYANFTMLSSTQGEFLFDFAQLFPTDRRIHVKSRVVMNPRNVKMFLHTLQRHIETYEAKHGEIPVEKPQTLADQLFSSVQPPEVTPDDNA